MVQLALVVLADYPALINYVLGEEAPSQPLEVWSGPFERWETHMPGEPYAIAPWYGLLLVRRRGVVRTPGAARRITIIQRQSFRQWVREVADDTDSDD